MAIKKPSSVEVFNKLNLDWTIVNKQLGQGGQATVIEVKKNGLRGAFRYIREKRKTDPERFFRELKILTSPEYTHPNIVRLLDYTKNTKDPWYISELGSSFEKAWGNYRNKLNVQELLSLAIEWLLQILSGLSHLHEAGVIHRDIKPENLVIINDRPVLIDLGVAFIEDSPRLTETDSAIGNYRFSPDVMMNRTDTVTPWLDVFMIAQLLISMVSETATKKWKRPLDWEWVRYSEELSDALVTSIRAFTALCSNPKKGPRNAHEQITLIKELFTQNNPTGVNPMFKINDIVDGINNGKAEQILNEALDEKLIKANAPIARKFYEDLSKQLDILYNQLPDNTPILRDCYTFEDMFRNLVETNDYELYKFTCGDENSKGKFFVRVNCLIYRPSLTKYRSGAKLQDSSNIFVFFLQRFARVTRVKFPGDTRIVTIECSGKLSLRNQQMKITKENISIDDITLLFSNWLSDKVAWSMIQRDR